MKIFRIQEKIFGSFLYSNWVGTYKVTSIRTGRYKILQNGRKVGTVPSVGDTALHFYFRLVGFRTYLLRKIFSSSLAIEREVFFSRVNNQFPAAFMNLGIGRYQVPVPYVGSAIYSYIIPNYAARSKEYTVVLY